ncbi:hypothetical protein F5B18DRAFT_645289 [Nemania serpens]|nr:hypothetical protein F5B18DRAFT_645289 [Nemania serpens]
MSSRTSVLSSVGHAPREFLSDEGLNSKALYRRRGRALCKLPSIIEAPFSRIQVTQSPQCMPSCPRQCLCLQVSEGTILGITPPSPQATLEAKPMVISNGLEGGDAAAAARLDRTTAPAGFGAMNMPHLFPTATGAILNAPKKNPAIVSRRRSRVVVALVPALRLAGHFERIFASALWVLLLQASLSTLGLLRLSQYVSIRILQVTGSMVYHATRLCKRAAWATWDSKHARRLRKKIEFEFFTLILGVGNNLFLVILWPGWGILALVALIIWAWCAA